MEQSSVEKKVGPACATSPKLQQLSLSFRILMWAERKIRWLFLHSLESCGSDPICQRINAQYSTTFHKQTLFIRRSVTEKRTEAVQVHQDVQKKKRKKNELSFTLSLFAGLFYLAIFFIACDQPTVLFRFILSICSIWWGQGPTSDLTIIS